MTEANRVALAQVRAHAQRERPRHMARIASVLAGARVEADAERLLSAASGKGEVAMNFHPDRLLADGRSVAQALHKEGVYRSQFETGISSGGLTAYPGGDRDIWERTLFAGAYQAPGAHACERPKYGGLNLMNYLNGACPRFGSCHLRLRRAATERATLIFGDSNAKPTDIGVIDAFAPVMAPLLESIAAGGGVLGRSALDVRAFVDGVLHGDLSRGRGVFAPAMGHTLNDYIEAQVHGVVSLADVEALVIDPAFVGTPTGDLLLATAKRHGLKTQWHAGLALALSQVPQDAPDVAEAELMRWQAFCTDGRARRLAEHVIEHHGTTPHLDAANIGQAAVSAVRDPDQWQDWGMPREVLQQLKDVWLILVAHGEPLP
ncbi:MAG: DUF3626 domain-containing protein [Actinomycetota bacterium]|nr:DUF3626 domain-containing protein [Actinomycetota bacterium]